MKKAILVVSFGTSFKCQLESCIEATENKIRNEFKDFEVRRAFTSNMIIKKLKNRDNLSIDTVKEALDKLKDEGFKEVYVQPLHIIYGEEYDKIRDGVKVYKEDFEKLELGTPLLYDNEDYFKAVEALKSQLPNNESVLLMSHGTAHRANSAYFQFEYIAHKMGLEKLFFASVEGYPLIEDVLEDLKEKEVKELTLMPLMLVAGDHAKNDMASDEEDSWKSILEKEGFKVNTYLKGLGENENFQNIYVDKIKSMINK